MSVLIPSNPSSKTKAVVLMYRWFGASKNHIQKYANFYKKRNCAVVYGVAPFLSVVFRHAPTFQAFAIKSVGQVCHIVRHVEEEKRRMYHDVTTSQQQGESPQSGQKSVPIITHSFSNGGTFVTAELTSMVQELKKTQNDEVKEEKQNQDQIDLQLFSERIQSNGFEVYASAPAYLYPEKFHHVVESAVSNKVAQWIGKFSMGMGNKLTQLSDFIDGRDAYPIRFWNNLIQNDLCKRQAFLYSTADSLTDSSKIEELIQARKSRGIQVLDLNFQDSEHVQHWRQYPKEYEDMLDEILRRC